MTDLLEKHTWWFRPKCCLGRPGWQRCEDALATTLAEWRKREGTLAIKHKTTLQISQVTSKH